MSDVNHNVSSGADSDAGMQMATLNRLPVHAENYWHFENYRRPEGCDCYGCHNLGLQRSFVLTMLSRDSEPSELELHDPLIQAQWNLAYLSLPAPLLNLNLTCQAPYQVWVEDMPNIVVTAGLNDIINQYFKGSAYTAAFYVGLVDNTSWTAYAAGDIMSAHSGWLESVIYSNGTRQALTLGTAAAGSADNSASKAIFNINGTGTVRGGFLTTNSTKSGTTGTLYGEADFANARAVFSGDTLNVTTTVSFS